MKLSAIGITPQKEKQFNGKGIFSVEDMVRYPRRGEKFRLGMKFTSTVQAQKAMNALEDGTKTLKDFVNTFDTTPNLTRKQICECL